MAQPFCQSNPPLGTLSTMRVGCVSYLNAKPLIDQLDQDADVDVSFDVPAKLLAHLESGQVDIALCPVIDYHRALVPLKIVPVGGIGCEGSTLTVRLYSQRPLDTLTAVHVDADSHTSVALLQVLMHQRYGRGVELIDYDARQSPAQNPPPAMLLIGDKVVTDSPCAKAYPHQLDLGQAWQDATGQPFVFAVWMARQDTDVKALAQRLTALRLANAQRLDAIVKRYASDHGWPSDLAKQYLGTILRYTIGPREREAITHFFQCCQRWGLIDAGDEVRLS